MNLGLVLVAYLLLFTAAVALLVLPAWRRGVLGWTQRQVSGCWQAACDAGGVLGAAATGLQGLLRRMAHSLAKWGTREWAIAGALLTALAAPSILALWLGTDRWLQGYDEATQRRIDPHIATLLQGEQLVPPSPLPPEVFSTREVEAERPLLASASREWSALDADFRQRLLLVFKLMREKHGYELALLEGYRSPERQELLRSRGAHVTQAGAFQSYHQFGLAADCAFYRDGKLVISEKDPWAKRGYELMGEVAESVGLGWGGRWTSIVDLGHLELRRPGVIGRATAPAN
ncbi:M15 family metallopeptidase [Ideonella sp. BN130291]|uniref:M15 family metallopeptidase n=1 Tax=Ideonella sp. BN130291 TaxID=3112940 RepID=UPI002E26C921|nr:M15 family metallopeptidase [Ideonella sp. BN130291]